MAKVKTVEQILESAISELLRKRDEDKKQIDEILKVVLQFAKDTKNTVLGKIEQLEDRSKEVFESLSKKLDGEVVSIKEIVETRLNRAVASLNKEFERMSKEQTRAINYLYDRVSNLKDGLDANPEEVAEIVINMLPKQESLDTSALEERLDDLEKELKRLRNIKSSGGGGTTLFGSVGHSPVHETFTMNGSDTTVTLRKGVAAQGTAIMVRYQGQMLDLTSQYTVSGNKVTFVGFTPEASTTISVTYWG